VAAPVHDAQNQVIASLGVVAPSARLQRSKHSGYGAQAVAAAQRIATGLGWSHPGRRAAG
jgi:IclR family acetate operon transcriptional repressor/IclR family KDG regulon transcriptional repressor